MDLTNLQVWKSPPGKYGLSNFWTPHHFPPEFPIIITADISRTVKMEPALLSLPDTENCLMYITHFVCSNVHYHILHFAVNNEKKILINILTVETQKPKQNVE